MILIGMLHFKKNPISVKKAYAYAAAAKLEGAELLYFTPTQIDFDNEKINGYKYLNGKWEKVKERFPDVIYRTGLSAKFADYKLILKKLRNKIPFTSGSLGDKMSIYKGLEEDPNLRGYLIPSFNVNNFEEIDNYIQKYNMVVLKANRGHRGTGVNFIEKLDHYYLLKTKEHSNKLEIADFKKAIIEKLALGPHHLQPFIESKTKTGNAYILRSHMQKIAKKSWVISSIYPEIAQMGSLIANLNCGGVTRELESFLYDEFGENYLEIINNIIDISLKVVIHLDKIFGSQICELGVDIGIDKEQKCWIMEINDLPGTPPCFDLEMDVAKNLVKYSIHLVNEGENE